MLKILLYKRAKVNSNHNRRWLAFPKLTASPSPADIEALLRYAPASDMTFGLMKFLRNFQPAGFSLS